jgi:exodeoxyribonuclease V gamma subunit
MVCLLGFSEEAFPRSDDRASFDLTRSEHRLGDRNKRHDDRHSFLQAILCARDRIVITYSAPAQSRRVAPNPSPVVWELTETLNRYYRAKEDDAPLVQPTIHPLHPFDPRYFDGTSYERSFSEHHLRIAKALDGAPTERSRIELGTDEDEVPANVVSVGELATWLWDPNRAFIDRCLRADFEQPELYEPSGALVRLAALDAATVGSDALRRGLEGDALAGYLAAAPEFPDGTPGILERRRMARQIDALRVRANAFRRNRRAESRSIGVEVGDGMIEGRIGGLYEDMRLVERFSRPRRRSELLAWVEHLLMQASGEPSLPANTMLVLRGDGPRACVVSYRGVARPRDELARLLSLYRASRRSPLPLFGSASWDYAETCADGKEEGAAKKAGDTLSSERAWNPRLDYLFGAEDPFDDESWRERFAEAANAVYGPFLAHRREE